MQLSPGIFTFTVSRTTYPSVHGGTIHDAAGPQIGQPIRIVERDVYDTFLSTWTRHSTGRTGDGRYHAYVMDEHDPLAFWLVPIPVTGTNVVVTFAGIPPDLTSVTDDLTVSDMYKSELVDYTVYRALGKDARGANPQLAIGYLNRFLASLGATRQVVRAVGANTTRPPGDSA